VEEVGEGVTAFKQGDKVSVRESYPTAGRVFSDISGPSVHPGHLANDNSTFQEYTTVPAEIAAKVLLFGVPGRTVNLFGSRTRAAKDPFPRKGELLKILSSCWAG